MAITGAPLLGDQFRTALAQVKGKVEEAGTRLNGALKELSDTADQAVGMAKQVEAETTDLKAALGLHSNGGPA